MNRFRAVAATVAVGSLGVAGVMVSAAGPASGTPSSQKAAEPHGQHSPISHIVVIFQENVSFDHYFGTYPNAANTSGQTFHAAAGTPAVNGLAPATDPSIPTSMRHTTNLLTSNPNLATPARLDPSQLGQVLECDQDHTYTGEQGAFDGGKMDKFVQDAEGYNSPTSTAKNPVTGTSCNKTASSDVMDYYDGNTVTALWNYAQHFAMSDNTYGTTFGPSAPGALNVTAGSTGGVGQQIKGANTNGDTVSDGSGGSSLISDAQPYYDDCSTRDAVSLTGKNIGDLLNGAGLSWGWFQGGFRPTTSFSDAAPGQGTATFTPDQFASGTYYKSVTGASNQGLCNADHPVGVALGGKGGTAGSGQTGQYGYKDDYIAHHEPFQYYASTANPHHLTIPTTSAGFDTKAGLEEIGTDTQHYVNGQPQFDTPNHQYDISDFNQLLAYINSGELPPSALPAVSYLKAAGYQDGHAAYSDPLDEQEFVTQEINAIETSPDWKSTAIFVTYDDSDGFYDHAYSGVSNPSNTTADVLTGTGACGSGTPLAGEEGRCGYGPRVPMLVISPYARPNYVGHQLLTQTSIVRFIEDNWGLGRIPGSADASSGSLASLFDTHPNCGWGGASALFLDPATGQPTGRTRSTVCHRD